ncbi:MAG: diguanylate cyclase [Pseudomonadota bacterium]|nr:diguanylate cyclase [Pseudomonadota bacterium]
MNERVNIQQKLEELKEQYAQDLPRRAVTIKTLWNELRADNPSSLNPLVQEVHRLSGSGQSFGFPNISTLARTLERQLEKYPIHSDGRSSAALDEAVEKLLKELAYPEAEATKSATPKDSRTILLIERAPGCCVALASQLESHGYKVIRTANLTGLNELISANAPDMGIIELTLPPSNDCLSDHTADIRALTIPFVALANQDNFSTRLAAVRLGTRGFISEPYSTSQIISQLDRLAPSTLRSDAKILIIDDDELHARQVAALLEAQGAQPEICSTPSDSLATARTFQPELILMDLHMPKCSGAELTAVLRQLDGTGHVPVLYLSAERCEQQKLDALLQGGDDFLHKPVDPDQLLRVVAYRVQRFQELRDQLSRDSLTGLLNQRSFKDFLSIEFERTKRGKQPLSFAMLDLDHFKKTNDQYGHAAGDQVLLTLSRLIRRRIRRSDYAGRSGGEEFAVILPNTDSDGAYLLMESLRRQFSEQKYEVQGKVFRQTLSIGIATLTGNEYETPHDLADAADQALYKAKHAGRNTTFRQ